MDVIYVASGNKGKLRDFSAAAARQAVTLHVLPGLDSIGEPEETGATFQDNARLKAAYYSRFAPGALVIADDSGLSVDALGGAPGVFSARYAALNGRSSQEVPTDEANNAFLLEQLAQIPDDQRTARFICVIAAATDAQTLGTFDGQVEGMILHEGRGAGGFGYDPLFFIPQLGKSMAELAPEEKAAISHRGEAVRKFFKWYLNQ